MKKLSLLIALCMLLSIGGVYATWSYAGKAMDEVHVHMGIKLAGSQSDQVAEGQFIRVGTDAITVWIDDTDGDHEADAVCSGKMQYVFLPGKGADEDIVDGIIPQFQVMHGNPLTYKGVDIFETLHTAPTAIAESAITAITEANKTNVNGLDLSQYVGGYYFEITGEMINELVRVNLELKTLDDYTAFSEFLDGAATNNILGVTISKHSN